MSQFDVIATVTNDRGTATWLNSLVDHGASILRINAAHARGDNLKQLIGMIRSHVGARARILVDVPGNKVRTTGLHEPLRVTPGEPVVLRAEQLNYPAVMSKIQPGHVLVAADGTLQFRVTACDGNTAQLLPDMGGLLENNKGVHLVGMHTDLPFLSDYDHEVLRIAQEQRVDFVGLSFVRRPEDVEQARAIVRDSGVGIICKIETQEACDCLESILPHTQRILIDRGDLSSEIGMLHIARMERHIARHAALAGVKVFVATQLLAHMVEHPIPSTTEVVAMHALMQYAHGIQLSDETAVGQHPFAALDVVRKIWSTASVDGIRRFEGEQTTEPSFS